jgi:hypothetical protein
MLYMVTATLNPGVGVQRFQTVLNAAHSWYRLNANLWIICSPHEGTTEWTQRLSTYTRPSGQLFISSVNRVGYQGWMSHDFWEWFNAHVNH